jgi:hypothetical protein
VGRGGEDGSEADAKALRLADVGCREARVTRAVHDPERLVTADRTPRDAGGAEIVTVIVLRVGVAW